MEHMTIRDWLNITVMVGIAAVYIAWCWLYDRVIRGDIHWNESSGELFERLESGAVCQCRACRRTR